MTSKYIRQRSRLYYQKIQWSIQICNNTMGYHVTKQYLVEISGEQEQLRKIVSYFDKSITLIFIFLPQEFLRELNGV